MEIETQTSDIGTQTKQTPLGAVIIQRQEDKKKKNNVKKRTINSIPNAVPSQQQQFRIFKEIDYPYLMRNVKVQNQDDNMIKSLREIFGIAEKTPELVADEALEKSVIKGRSYPLYTDEELTRHEKRVKALNSDDRLIKYAGVLGLFDDTDAEAEASFIPPELRRAGEDYSKYLRAFDSKYLEGSTPLSEIPMPKVNIEKMEDKIASWGSTPLTYEDYSGRGRPSIQSDKFKKGSSSSRQETLYLGGGVAKKSPIDKALEDYEFIQSTIQGRELTQSELQKERERIAGGILKKWTKVALQKEKTFDLMMEKSIREEGFNYRLEQMRKAREMEDRENRQRKDIEKSFGLYDTTRRARMEGQMASLLFDID